MRTIPTKEFKLAVKDIFPDAQFPITPRASQVLIPSLRFIQKEWKAFWEDYKKSRGLTGFNRGICNLITQTAVNEFDWLCNAEAAKNGSGDIAGGMVIANLFIPKEYELNGVPEGHHSTALIGIDEDDGWRLYFWEPQEPPNETKLYPAGDAYLDFVRCFDVFI